MVKVGSASQGIGKSRVLDQPQWNDTLSLLGMQEHGFTTEPLVDWVGDVRVQVTNLCVCLCCVDCSSYNNVYVSLSHMQKIGMHYRAIRRCKTAAAANLSVWKANEGIGISEEDVPVALRWRVWADACATVLDMDLL